MVDITPEYWAVALAAAQARGDGEDKVRKLRSAQLLRSLAAKSDFTKAAIEVANNILALRQYLKENQRDYAQQGKLREAERDRIEGDVGAYVRTCSANIEKLQAMLLAEGRPPPGTEDLVAHRQGMVLILSERLRALTAAFDRLRSLRFQQLQQQEVNRQRRLPAQLPGGGLGGGGSALPARGGLAPPAPGWPPQTTAQFHELLTNSQQQAQQRGGGPLGQQQTLMDPENQALQLELMSMGEQVQQAERTVREIATLNQMFSTAIMHQSEQIEKLYSQAVEASQSISTGNVQLRKAIKTTASARKYLLIFLLVASLGLLFLDWWSS